MVLKIRKTALFSIALFLFTSDFMLPRDVYKSGSYFFNGEKRTLLLTRPWGGIFYLNKRVGSVSYQENSGRLVVGNDEYRVNDRMGDLNITKKGVELMVKYSPEKVEVELNGRSFTFNFDYDELEINLGTEKYFYLANNGTNSLIIRGKQGEVTYSDDNFGNKMIKSKVGTTVFKQDMSGQYSFSGTPEDQHPYRFWAVEFLLPDSGIGVFIDLCMFGNICNFTDQYQWKEVVTIE